MSQLVNRCLTLKRRAEPGRRMPRMGWLEVEWLEDRTTPSILFSPNKGQEQATGPGPGGYTLSGTQIYPIFWGSGWATANPSSDTLLNAVAGLAVGPYLSGLAQYGCTTGAAYGHDYKFNT